MPIATLNESQRYHYFAVATNGCVDTGFVTVEIIFDSEHDVFIPNIFCVGANAPQNKLFYISTKGISRKYNLSIFDRWGGLIYHENNLLSNDNQTGWDGKLNNSFAQSGVYIYKIVLDGNDKPILGTITIIQ
jgi:gliding motility-associated-like protein